MTMINVVVAYMHATNVLSIATPSTGTVDMFTCTDIHTAFYTVCFVCIFLGMTTSSLMLAPSFTGLAMDPQRSQHVVDFMRK